MKKTLLSIVAMATLSFSTFGQAPEGFKYQAVVRDAGNVILNNQAVGVRLTVQQGSIGGTTVYQETFAPTTNAYGLVNLEIGTGTTTDNFSTIDWSNGPYFIETAVDNTGGTSYVVMGASQLMSVPYALHAKTAENVANDQVNDADADPSNEIQNILGSGLSGTNLTIGIQGGNNQVVDLSSLQDGTGTDDQNIQGSGLSGTNLTIGIQGGTNQVVDLSSLQDGTGTDDQNIQGSGLSGTDLTIGIQGGTNQVVDLSSLQDGTGTDDQNIQGSGLSGTDLTIGIQGGNNQTIDLSPLLGNLVDADGDTKIQVEEGTDDDVIRFDVEGLEFFRFVQGRVNLNNTGFSTIYGQSAGVNEDFSNNHNSFFGASSGNANVNSFGNSGFGSSALKDHTSGNFNVAIGYQTMESHLTGGNNVAIGNNVLGNSTNSSDNVAIGSGALLNSPNVNNNVAIGRAAGQDATGSGNVFVGYAAGAFETTSNRLYIENSSSGTPLIYGEFDNNLVRINGAFESNSTATIGNINTGSESDPQVVSTIHAGDGFLVTPWVYTNAIHAQSERGTGSTLITVGNDGNFGANNQINFMTNGTKRMTLMDGGLGLNEENPDSDLHIKQSSNSIDVGGTGGIRFSSSTLSTWDWRIYNDGGYLSFNSPQARVAYVNLTGAWVQNSDRTMKKNISPLSSVLDRVMQLKPVDYHYNQQKDSDNKVIGFVAQEVEPLFPEIVVHSEGKLGMTYANTGVIAIKAVQEQQEIINAQQQEIDLLKAKFDELKNQLDAIMNENK